MRVSGALLAVVLSSALLGGAAAAYPAALRWLPAPPRVSQAGRTLPPGEALAAWVARRADAEAKSEVLLRHPEGVLVVERRELGLSLDVEAALSELTKPRPQLPLVTRLRVAWGGPAPEPEDIVLRFRCDVGTAASWLESVAPGLRRDPVDARLDLKAKRRVEASAGRELAQGTSLARIAALGGDTEAELAFTVTSPEVPTSALVDVDPSLVLSEYETDFATRGGPRVENIALAARLLDGSVMAPGEVWSFNRTVGKRTLERGFVDAPVIVQDELEPGVGGGVCQVASTLFAASVLGAVDIVRRRSHSRPTGYTPLGLDAAVIDGELDLQLRNPYPVPLIVHAYLPVPTRVRVELLGAVTPGKVEHSYTVRESADFFRRIARRPELGPEQIKRRQKGMPGYEVVSAVRTRYVDGSQRVRHYSSTYYPVPEIYWVGSDVELDSLPALPPRATHAEVQEGIDGQGDDATTPAAFAP